ncbi:hypothetical protein A2U01_0087720, partial [Trifolium medium]|nr:hypothetical protein [Trifolium medium]
PPNFPPLLHRPQPTDIERKDLHCNPPPLPPPSRLPPPYLLPPFLTSFTLLPPLTTEPPLPPPLDNT